MHDLGFMAADWSLDKLMTDLQLSVVFDLGLMAAFCGGLTEDLVFFTRPSKIELLSFNSSW